MAYPKSHRPGDDTCTCSYHQMLRARRSTRPKWWQIEPDEVVIERLVRRGYTPVPFGEKKSYVVPLHERGFTERQIMLMLRMSGSEYKHGLRRDELRAQASVSA